MALPPAPSARAVREWSVFAVVIAARFYRTILLTLAFLAIAPLALSWQAFVIHSGSMEPSISVGDVAHGTAFDADDEVAVGRVYMYGDPSSRVERTMVHRIVERRDDGDFTTAGDANDVTDITPLTVDDIDARAVLLVPYVGLPVVWFQTGEWLRLMLWLLFTVAAFVVATRYVDGEPPRWTMLRLLREGLVPEKTPARERDPVLVRVAGAAVATAMLCVVGGTATTASATFTDRAQNPGNTWTVGTWLLPYVKAVMASTPQGFWLLDELSGTTVTDRSGTYPAGRIVGAVALGLPGATPTTPSTAFGFQGGRVILHDQVVSPPSTYSVELWFRTTSTSAGYLIGFESETGPTSAAFDRTVLLDAQGRIQVGDWDGRSVRVLTTPGRYNDGRWHHLVVTAEPTPVRQKVEVYVDGTLVASDQTTQGGTTPGHWRIGSGTALGPRAVTFHGAIDAVAVYHRVLAPSEVTAHWNAR